MIHLIVWVLIPCCGVVAFHPFGGHAASIFSMRWRQHAPLGRWCAVTSLQGITTRKTM